MITLEQLKPGLQIDGLLLHQTVTLIQVESHGTDAVGVVFRRADNQLGQQLLFRENEPHMTIVHGGRRWTFDTDGSLLQLVSEAYRIRLAHLFDPVLAVHTSLIEPLPHQITAVYDEMLLRQPLRYLLADDPGAGKTVMAGLLISELKVRGDVRRCLICAPGNLAVQWQDELWSKFHLDFRILTRDMLDTTRSGNPFTEHDYVIVRLDQVSRSDSLQALLRDTDWDLVVCDEAHKMSASFFSGDLRETRRYKLGKLLGNIARHFLLMTATPHNGKEEDFQLFMALLDADRFEGRFRDGVHEADVSDIMRRMVKERLLKFDGKPLFPERRAYTVDYGLSPEENELYQHVTDYVRQEFNRADQLENDGRRGTVGFALTVLQRRLASSPEAIHQSLRRRRKRLEKKLHDMQQTRQSIVSDQQTWDDLDEVPEDELDDLDEVTTELEDGATAARTIHELTSEIATLDRLEALAANLRRSGTDRKWMELRRLLQDTPDMRAADGSARKLVIFTEHLDTLNYLRERLTTLTGQPEALVCIHGSLSRDERRQAEAAFRNDPHVAILVATDAAGEGINLQRAHLMVNYDLPWNPNRLEQRFGRIHRIGQTEVCHLWNLVAGQTREGSVYQRLLVKLQAERGALNGEVFDVLGKLFRETPLRKLLVSAVRYGDEPAVRARLEQVVDNATDQTRVRDLLEQQSLVSSVLDTSQILRIRADMERAAARRLQPHYIKAFFLRAFERLGGALHQRETGRYEVTHVPATIRHYASQQRLGAVVARYERICFDKAHIRPPVGHPGDGLTAAFVCPGHPLLDATLGLLLERERDALRHGGVLVDAADPTDTPRVLFYLEQSIQDALPTRADHRPSVSQEVHFVEVDAAEQVREAGGAPYLDYRPATTAELALLQAHVPVSVDTWERVATSHAVAHLAPRHLDQVRRRRTELLDKIEGAVQKRLTSEIHYWGRRAVELHDQERAGRANAGVNRQRAKDRAEKLRERLAQRQEQIAQERQLSAAPPLLIGRALVVPQGLLDRLQGRIESRTVDAQARREVELAAMRAVVAAELALGNTPSDVSAHNHGYDIESRDPQTQRLRFIEVKGRQPGATTVTVTRNEILTALNTPEHYILALVAVANGVADAPRYVHRPFEREPDADATSVNYNLVDLLRRSEPPH